MANHRIRNRLFSEKEVGGLIQRATEIQGAANASAERGLSLQEIEQIAAEIGIEPGHVREAALELQRGPNAGSRFRIWGGPFVLEQERIVEGGLTEAQWEQIVLGLRRSTGSSGRVSEIGQIREWTRTLKDLDYVLEHTQVTVSPREDQTRINIRKQYRGGALASYVLAVLLSGTVAGIFLDGSGLSDAISALILSGSGVSGLMVTRASIGYWTKRQRAKLKALTDWVHEVIAAPEAVEVGSSSLAALSEPSEKEEAEPVETSTTRHVRT